jgi:hypothetical protein
MSDKIMTLEEALKDGLVVKKEDINKIVEEEVAKKSAEMKKTLQKELVSEKKARTKRHMEAYLDGTGLTDIKFADRLLALNISKEYAKCLRDEHMKLRDKQIWAYIRATYNPKVHI